MRNTLIDAGPLIALFNMNDTYHKQIIEFLKEYEGILTSTWPVLTEVSYMLAFNVNAQIDFLKWVHLGGVKIKDIENNGIARIIKLIEKYSDVPMDLADASLVYISEKNNIKEIITRDTNYYIYRTIHKEMIKNIFSL